MATATTTSIADLPSWQKAYAEDILARAQQLGKQAYTLPAYQVAQRTPLQQQATQLAMQGIGSYQPMLQAGATTVGGGIGATHSISGKSFTHKKSGFTQKFISSIEIIQFEGSLPSCIGLK